MIPSENLCPDASLDSLEWTTTTKRPRFVRRILHMDPGRSKLLPPSYPELPAGAPKVAPTHPSSPVTIATKTAMAQKSTSQDHVELEPNLTRYKLIVTYNGSRYKGFQRQSSGTPINTTINDEMNPINVGRPSRKRSRPVANKKVPLTIQECIEDGLQQYTNLHRSQLRVRFSGRTDGGVHARGQVLAVSLPDSITRSESNTPLTTDNLINKLNIEIKEDHAVELWNIRKSINSRLPDDISIEEVIPLKENPDFDPRKDAIRKQYSYTLKYRRKVYDKNGNLLPICNSGPNCIRNGLDPKTMWISPWALDDSKMHQYCNQLTGEHDYSAFVHKRSRREQDNTLTVEKFACQRLEETKEDAAVVTVRFFVEAKGFRRSMVRNLVGFLVDLCRGKVEASILDHRIWTGTDEIAQLVHSAPPFGLCLEHVTYSE